MSNMIVNLFKCPHVLNKKENMNYSKEYVSEFLRNSSLLEMLAK